MKVSSLRDLLRHFEDAATALTGASQTRGLTELRLLFAGHEDDSVTTFVNTLIKHRDLRGHNCSPSPALAQVRDTLAKLEALLGSADAKKAAADVTKLAELLENCGQASVTEFVGDARGWLEEARRPKPKPEKPSRKKPAASPLRLDEYAQLLKNAFKDNSQFDDCVARLRADKNIKKADMREVARLVLGFELAQKNGREDALAAIVERQRIEARQQARGSVLDRLKPW